MDIAGYARFIIALIFVLALIAALTALARRFGLGGALGRTRNATRRLGLVEVLALDTKRRLVLVRRDATEHLLLIGGDTDLVIERDVVAESAEPFAAHLSAATALAPTTPESGDKP